MGIIQTGNSFDSQSFGMSHARKVWREIRRQWPAGGLVTNTADWVGKGKVPCGTPCKYAVDATGAKTVECFTDAQVLAADNAAALGINGYTDRDIPVPSANAKVTATVIRDGDIYEYMFEPAVVAKLKGNTECPLVVFVQ